MNGPPAKRSARDFVAAAAMDLQDSRPPQAGYAAEESAAARCISSEATRARHSASAAESQCCGQEPRHRERMCSSLVDAQSPRAARWAQSTCSSEHGPPSNANVRPTQCPRSPVHCSRSAHTATARHTTACRRRLIARPDCHRARRHNDRLHSLANRATGRLLGPPAARPRMEPWRSH